MEDNTLKVVLRVPARDVVGQDATRERMAAGGWTLTDMSGKGIRKLTFRRAEDAKGGARSAG